MKGVLPTVKGVVFMTGVLPIVKGVVPRTGLFPMMEGVAPMTNLVFLSARFYLNDEGRSARDEWPVKRRVAMARGFAAMLKALAIKGLPLMDASRPLRS